MNELPTERREQARWLISAFSRPSLIACAAAAYKSLWARLTGLFVMLIFTLMQITNTPTTWEAIGRGLVALVIFAAAAAVIQWCRVWWRYIRDLEARARTVRHGLLGAAGINPAAPEGQYRHRIQQITRDRRTGALQLFVDRPGGTGLQVGSRRAVLFSATNDLYGTVTVTGITQEHAVVVPSDRRRSAFWEELEQLADRNPVAPEGFHLEAAVPDWLA